MADSCVHGVPYQTVPVQGPPKDDELTSRIRSLLVHEEIEKQEAEAAAAEAAAAATEQNAKRKASVGVAESTVEVAKPSGEAEVA